MERPVPKAHVVARVRVERRRHVTSDVGCSLGNNARIAHASSRRSAHTHQSRAASNARQYARFSRAAAQRAANPGTLTALPRLGDARLAFFERPATPKDLERLVQLPHLASHARRSLPTPSHTHARAPHPVRGGHKGLFHLITREPHRLEHSNVAQRWPRSRRAGTIARANRACEREARVPPSPARHFVLPP